jgi:hypothetical protein
MLQAVNKNQGLIYGNRRSVTCRPITPKDYSDGSMYEPSPIHSWIERCALQQHIFHYDNTHVSTSLVGRDILMIASSPRTEQSDELEISSQNHGGVK